MNPTKEKNNREKLKKISQVLISIFIISVVIFKGGIVNAMPAEITSSVPSVMDRLQNYVEKVKSAAKKIGFSNIVHSMLQNFSRQMASQVATKIASGGPGGQALGWDIPWGLYLENATNAAVGDFLGNLSDIVGVNLCDPGKLGKLQLTLGLIEDVVQPPKPKCDWEDIKRNWDKLEEGEFLKKLGFSFNPDVSYLGSSFYLRKKLQDEVFEKQKLAEIVRGVETNDGFKSINDTISGFTKTPAKFVEKSLADVIDEDRSLRQSKIIGSYVLSDVVGPFFETFLSTLSGKLMQKWLTRGVFPDTLHSITAYELFQSPESQGTSMASHTAVANYYNKELITPSFSAGGNYDILGELSSCPFPDNPGPTNCVIDTSLRAAIEQKVTVGQALENGDLEKNGVFGFINSNAEPKYNEGYPYRSLKILRYYRILPVGWEIAAEYIQKFGLKKSLEEMVDCYDPNDQWNETNTKEEWCRGLVDPDWLLKSPANTCEKEAYGPEIVSEQVIPGVDANNDGDYLDAGESPPKRIIARNKTCVDSNSCIKESAEGKCLKWGDCTEEKRIWRFRGESCDEQFNTCQTFKSQDGKEVSYLKNTLEYGICDSSNAGCAWYCGQGNYNSGTKAVDWSCNLDKAPPYYPLKQGGELLFNNYTEKCNKNEEGCHKYIKVQSGTNLLYDGDLENGEEGNYDLSSAKGKFHDWPIEKTGGNLKISQVLDGSKGGLVYKIETDALDSGLYSFDGIDAVKLAESMMPEGYGFTLDKTYILSADIKVEKGEAAIGIGNTALDAWTEATSTSSQWKRIAVELPENELVANKIYAHSSSLDAGSAIFYVDNIKLEEVENQSQDLAYYRPYTSAENIVHIKKAPDYLNCTPPRFTNGVDSRPLECSKYAMECRKEEVGCNQYTPVNGKPWIPGIISQDDKCDLSCVNYKSYKQSATNFSKEVMNVNFIASNPYNSNLDGTVCPSEAVGCSEFTNLDELEKGGEAREYYTDLRQCVKPDEPGVSCENFYTWIGSDTAGYELKTYYLEKGNDGKPAVIENPQNFGNCANSDDAKNNPNCKEFYDDKGAVSYAIYQNTVTCSADCHPYRKTRERINETSCAVYEIAWVTNQNIESKAALGGMTACEGSDCVCKLEVENCVLSGGQWKEDGCVYKAVPAEGIKCAAQNMGCNEYKGTAGSNIRNILAPDGFEDRTNEGWVGGIPSSQATVVGGQSLTVDSSSKITKDLTAAGAKLSKDKIYEISFLAINKGGSPDLSLMFKAKDIFSQRNITVSSNEWKEYKIGPIVLSGDLNTDGVIDNNDVAKLTEAKNDKMSVTARQRELADINGDGKIIDADITLLNNIKGSLASLNTEIIEISGMTNKIFLDNIIIREVQENIYRIKDTWQIPAECDSPFVGAQLGCDEYNDVAGNLLALKSFKLCSSEAMGCERMIDTQDSESLFSATYSQGDIGEIVIPRDKITYLVNDQKKYCLPEAKGCQRFGVPQYNQEKNALLDGDGKFMPEDTYLINNPDRYGNILCKKEALACREYKFTGTAGVEYFKDPNDKLCLFDSVSGKWMKKGSEDEECPYEVNINKTIGADPGVQIKLPTNGWVGICDKSQTGCTEYLDPLSNNEPNLVFNGNFEQDAQALDGGNGDGPDGWGNILGCKAGCSECCSKGYSESSAVKKADQKLGLIENALYTLSARVTGEGYIAINGCNLSSPDESIIDNKISFTAAQGYGMQNTVSGRFYVNELSGSADCTLSIDAANGFVDEVSVQKTDVYYNIASTLEEGECAGNENASAGCALLQERKFSQGELKKGNRILKVEPDRVCGKWLVDNSGYISENGEAKSLELMECVADTPSGACSIPIIEERKDQNFTPGNVSLMRNISGLSKVGFEWEGRYAIEGNYPLSRMPQIGQYINFNGSFEEAKLEGDPGKWAVNDWEGNFKIIDNPIAAQRENLPSQAPVGKNFLKLEKNNLIKVSKELPVYGNTDYIISGYIDTRNILTTSVQSGIYISIFDKDGNEMDNDIALELNEGVKWAFLSKEFKTPEKAIRISITLKNDTTAQGSSYFDEISIRPALEIQNDVSVPSLCRVYPEEGSLSCEYTADNGISYKGERGYCLEYDREPGNPNNCINWFPIDVIRGEEGRAMPSFATEPLYYCLEAENPKFSYLYGGWSGIDERGQISLVDGKILRGFVGFDGIAEIDPLLLEQHYKTDPYNIIVDSDLPTLKYGNNVLVIDLYSTSGKGNSHMTPNFYYYNGDLHLISSSPADWKMKVGVLSDGVPGVTSLNFVEDATWVDPTFSMSNDTGSWIFRTKFYIEPNTYCKKIALTAIANGESAVWNDRVKLNSSYTVPNLKYKFNDMDYPFGRIKSSKLAQKNINDLREPVSLVDAVENSTPQKYEMTAMPYSCHNAPLSSAEEGLFEEDTCALTEDYYRENLETPDYSLGTWEEGRNRLSRLFVKSYDVWEWDGNKYKSVKGMGYDLNPPQTICNGTDPRIRPTCEPGVLCNQEFCSIPPLVKNIKIENVGDEDVNIGISGSILLNFNTEADDNQQPLIGYNIDWGDGNRSIAENVRFIPQPVFPYSFSHSYSYYDLKNKFDNDSTIDKSALKCFSDCSTYGVGNGASCCVVQPRIRVKDNWDWCSDGINGDPCPANNEANWAKFDGWVVLTNK